MEDNQNSPQPTRTKSTSGGNIFLGGRVSAQIGELMDVLPERMTAAAGSKKMPRKKRAPVCGNIIQVIGPKKFRVHFDNGKKRDFFSNNLKALPQCESMPVDDAILLASGGLLND